MYELDFLCSLALTIVIETCLLWLIVRRLYKLSSTQVRRIQILAGGILASGATLPYVWFLFPALIQNRAIYTVVVESFAVGAETAIYAMLFRLGWKQALILSACCNAGSFLIGKVLA